MRRRAQNLQRSDTYKEALKSVRALISAGKKEDAQKLLPALQKALDKATKVGVIKANKASRLKSRIATALTPKK